jgi:phage baseplate assembly protein W
MKIANTVPSTDDEKIVKTLAFPFQKGPSSFPAMSTPENRVFASIVMLMSTSIGERVGLPDFGVNIQEYVFSNMTPIQKARIANQVSNAVETFIPGVIVNNIKIGQLKYQDGVGSEINFDITYTVSGETSQQQVIYTPTLQGQ